MPFTTDRQFTAHKKPREVNRWAGKLKKSKNKSKINIQHDFEKKKQGMRSFRNADTAKEIISRRRLSCQMMSSVNFAVTRRRVRKLEEGKKKNQNILEILILIIFY